MKRTSLWTSFHLFLFNICKYRCTEISESSWHGLVLLPVIPVGESSGDENEIVCMCIHVNIYSDPAVTDLCCSLPRRRSSATPSQVQLRSLPQIVNRMGHSATVRVSSGRPSTHSSCLRCMLVIPQVSDFYPSAFQAHRQAICLNTLHTSAGVTPTTQNLQPS